MARTSSTIVRQMLMECNEILSARNCRRDSQLSFLTSPSPNIYSLASSTSCKLTLPQFFSGLAQLFDNFFLAHSGKRRRSLRNAIAQFIQEFFGFCFFTFHRLSPYFKFTMKLKCCQLYHKIILVPLVSG